MPAVPHTRLRIVQSRHNARVKELRAALARPCAERIGLEGLHLVQEALASSLQVQTIFVRNGSELLLDSLPSAELARVPELLSVPDEVLRSAVSTESPQAVAALAAPPIFTLEQLFATGSGIGDSPSLLVVLAGLQDPGNVGAILRSAEAFGASGVLALPGTASVWNPKSLRASMGSAFRLPFVPVTTGQALEALQARGILSFAAVAPGHARSRSLEEVNLRQPIALWIGNEGSGLPPELIAACEATITILCPGPVESLNAAIAASILLYQASQQRANVIRQHPDAPSRAARKGHPSPA